MSNSNDITEISKITEEIKKININSVNIDENI